MCGIFGWVRQDRPLTPDEIAQARAALATLTHRGPDGFGEWHEGQVFLGHRRLKVIDLSDDARQPFADPSGRYRLSYNGELYNYVELRQDLEGRGYRFRTQSDTEVMLAAFVEWDLNALDRFDGMFAAALHDRSSGRHLLFRDPMGQKPLYWHWTGRSLVYASELRALLGLSGMGWSLDRDAFLRFLANGYYALAETPLAHVAKLLPGCVLDLMPGAEPRVSTYWTSRPGVDSVDMDDEKALDCFEDLFTTACRRIMRADVPFGVFLSGGLDSSLVYAFCRALDPSLSSFSVGMAEADFDESEKARAVHACVGGGEHRIMRMDETAIIDGLDQLLAHNDEPHADPGFVNASFIARSSRPYITVGLTGDGGDELFAGYAPFHGLAYEPVIASLPGPVVTLLKSASSMLPQADKYLSLAFKLKSYLQAFPAAHEQRFALWLAALAPETLAELCPWQTKSFFSRYGSEGLFGAFARIVGEISRGSTALQQLLFFYQKTFLPEFVCLHTDRAGMQHSLEVRTPFLAPDLVRFANRLPDRFKLRGRTDKWLLRAAAKRRGLPSHVVSQKKQGFTFPLARWLKTSLRPHLMNFLDREEWAADRLVDWNRVSELRTAHLEGAQNNYRVLYSLVVFRAWRRRFPQVAV